MSVDRMRVGLLTVTMMLLFQISVVAADAAAPVKLILSSRIGSEVDKVTKENICTAASKHECQLAVPTGKAGGFRSPEDVATIPSGLSGENNVYVADQANSRIQALTGTGQFVSTFGKKVNKKGGNFCVASEINECQAGEKGSGADSLASPQSVAVDPGTGDVYVLDQGNFRVAKYTPSGQFLLMIGKEVDATNDGLPGATEAQKNLCTAASGDLCQAGAQSGTDSTEKGAFNFAASEGNLLAVGSGTEHVLYVADEHRIQEFNENGQWIDEIKLPPEIVATAPGSQITSLAVDDLVGVAYVVYARENVIHEYDTASGSELGSKIEIAPREINEPIEVAALAVDSAGHLAALAYEGQGGFIPRQQYGSLYKASDGQLLTTFATFGSVTTESGLFAGVTGIGFNSQGRLYSALGNHEVWTYSPVSVAEFSTEAFLCSTEPVSEDSSTSECILNGSVNPYNVPDTRAWFEWGIEVDGHCAPGVATTTETLPVEEAAIAIKTTVKNLRPNGGFCYRVAGTDENSELPEKLTGLVVFAKVPIAAPKALGQPRASFAKPSSALLSGELNPENASTEYFFEYAPGSKTLFELCLKGILNEPCPGVTRTSILVSEIYGRIGATLEASGLQPSTEYHYRLAVKNEAAEVLGAEGIAFRTPATPAIEEPEGIKVSPVALPPVLETPPATVMLAAPPIAFPKSTKPPVKCKHGYLRNNHGRCVKAKAKSKKGKKGRKHR